MTPRPSEQPSATETLRKRLNELETEFRQHTLDESRARAVTAGLTGGAVALLLSMSLPWVRSGNDLLYQVRDVADDGVDARKTLSLGREQAVATGWDLFGAGALWWVFLAVLVLVVLAVVGLFVTVRGLALFTVSFAAVPPVLLMFVWPLDTLGKTSAGPGMGVMLVGCLVVALASYRSTHDGSREVVGYLDSSHHAGR